MNAFPAPDPDPALAGRLLAWYRRHRRELPWRRTADPYAIWVAETMLQQTQVATVTPYYERFLARFPTVAALAEAPEQEVLRFWAGLGYYARARNLQRAAREVLARFGGRLPEEPDQLRQLPGVGPYTAGALASLAYNRPAAIVDGNVERVLARLFALRGDPKRGATRAAVWRLAEALIPAGEARDFNSALMELGATLCLPARPRCGDCPLAGDCRANAEGIQGELPETAPRPAVQAVRAAAAVAWRAGAVLLGQVPPGGRWAGLWQFPNAELRPDEQPAAAAARALGEWAGLSARPAALAAEVRHSVTRYRVRLQAFHCETGAETPVATGCAALRWVTLPECDDLPLPAPHRRLAERLAGGQD